jgi:CRISPR-associated protein Csm5
VADALTKEGTLAEIKQFTRDTRNRPYVPGSSLKGALRTAILIKLIAGGQKRPLRLNSRTSLEVEPDYLNLLERNTKRPKDEVNSVMRGVSVSDSLPINNRDIMLARKVDVSLAGRENPINVIRESVKPNVKIQFKLTLDTSVKSFIDAAFIRQAVAEYGEYYRKVYYSRFKLPAYAQPETFDQCLVLGGGAGYFSKNIVYPMLGYPEGLNFVASYMEGKFQSHHHDEDTGLGISPHMLKYTLYQTRRWHMGVCAFKMEETP